MNVLLAGFLAGRIIPSEQTLPKNMVLASFWAVAAASKARKRFEKYGFRKILGGRGTGAQYCQRANASKKSGFHRILGGRGTNVWSTH